MGHCETGVVGYVFYQDTLTIEVTQEEPPPGLPGHLVEEGAVMELQLTHRSRVKELLGFVFGKFHRRQETSKRQYFSPIDIFRALPPNAEEMQEYYEQVEQIERNLERLRIGEFSDVNENDKAFFVSWNESVRQYRQERQVVTGSSLEKLVDDFAAKAKREGLSRVNLVQKNYKSFGS